MEGVIYQCGDRTSGEILKWIVEQLLNCRRYNNISCRIKALGAYRALEIMKARGNINQELPNFRCLQCLAGDGETEGYSTPQCWLPASKRHLPPPQDRNSCPIRIDLLNHWQATMDFHDCGNPAESTSQIPLHDNENA